MKKAIVLLSIFALLNGLCACQMTPVSNTDDPTQATTMPTETQPTDPKPTETQPTERANPRIAEMQTLLEWKGENRFYNYALTSEYTTPADVNLFNLFQSGFSDESDVPSDEELILLEGKLGQNWKEMDLVRLPVEKMNNVLVEFFGITLEQTNAVGLDSLVYLAETNCYYTANSGAYYAEITVDNVEVQGDGSLLIQYNSRYIGNYMVRLMPTDGGYQILSNVKA